MIGCGSCCFCFAAVAPYCALALESLCHTSNHTFVHTCADLGAKAAALVEDAKLGDPSLAADAERLEAVTYNARLR